MKKLFCVYDVVAKEFASPFMQNNADAACRAFLAWIKSDPKINSEDYKLFEVGDFDPSTGAIVPGLKEVPFSLGGEE